MTLPGLATFYSGLVQSKSVLSVVIQCFSISAIASVLWFVVGYSLAFGETIGWFIGMPDKAFFYSIHQGHVRGNLPEIVFVMFQKAFAIIAPAIIVGAYIERMKFPAVLFFSAAWHLLVYAPICHWVWGDGWLRQLGIMDFAGGIVLHSTVGVAALISAVYVGKRRIFPHELVPAHNPGLAAAGAGMIWVGWFGFNGGSELAADGNAGMAIAVTHLSASAGLLTWIFLDWIKLRRPTLVGATVGAVAGLAAATPASGFVGPMSGMILGIAASAVCFFAVGIIKWRLEIDDSLDVFAVHGLGGILGTLLIPLLALEIMDGHGYLVAGRPIIMQLGVQFLGVLASMVWAGIFTFIILKVLDLTLGGIRVDPEDEMIGLDVAVHGERGYDL
ncbi:MAG: ammonium transporter [Chloroflexi bacterium]|nr:ammonium transporter [Chloroflexota bacterium]